MMSCSIACWLLPFTLVLFLGPPTQRAQPFSSPPGPPRFLNKEDAQELWKKHQLTMINQAAKAHALALRYWNQKFNTTFFGTPGELTRILMETAVGRIFHVIMNLVQVKCPKDQPVNLQNCVIRPESPKLVCKLSVIVFFQHTKAYISEEGCQEAQDPPTPPEEEEPPYPYEKEEGPVYM
ncbi:uncharacterized protein LOC143831743 [Paroedura picta]|uniref:uncharacterized protein LOC143831743 n=1 Tax=Paroedura picta TaxID=143630 RepID=UPI0040569761